MYVGNVNDREEAATLDKKVSQMSTKLSLSLSLSLSCVLETIYTTLFAYKCSN